MMRQAAFEGDGKFFKGNLHTHTELSDGQSIELVRFVGGGLLHGQTGYCG